MLKKYLSFILVFVFVFALAGSSQATSAKYDISVFENSEKYTVEFDDMNDTGEITPKEGNMIIGLSDDDDNEVLLGSFDIKILEDFPPIVRVSLIYCGEDWIFTDKVIVKPANTRYTFEVDRDTDVSDGKIYESFTLALTDESIQMLHDIVDNEVASVRCRLDGDRDVNFSLIFNLETLADFLKDYEATGSLDNDFSLVKKLFPCAIK